MGGRREESWIKREENNMALLKAEDLTPAALEAMLKLLKVHGLRLWLEAADGWTLDFWPGLEGKIRWCAAGRSAVEHSVAEVLARGTFGRLFAPSGELKWRQFSCLGERCFRTLFLGDEDWVP